MRLAVGHDASVVEKRGGAGVRTGPGPVVPILPGSTPVRISADRPMTRSYVTAWPAPRDWLGSSDERHTIEDERRTTEDERRTS